mmetsp:Transcript_22644/g.64271  ORF Transcript_22644/g.64271 Transcript_22644/m.64271 type:complete len:85 (+) Transcript_22644:1128-1382(+)
MGMLGSGSYICCCFPPPREQASTQARAKSNVAEKCAVCLERRHAVALAPCGHLICTSCVGEFGKGQSCPVCRKAVQGHQALYAA